MHEVGSLLVGKYRVDRVLGKGGMGMVVAATHVQLNQPVAIKLLLDEMVDNEMVVERFLREARASARLRGEHVCKVSDVGTLDNGAPFIVMELLEGSDLASQLAAYGPMAVERAVDYLLQTCLGVAEAHSHGIIHRDLKPANLFLTKRPDGSPLLKVLDFGIAKATKDNDFKLTRTALVMGSPGYMSPEQLRSSRAADVRSDVWALGVILYELVAGEAPFKGESLTELTLHVAMDPTPPFTVAVPPGFESVVARSLAKDAADRFQNVAELAYALAPFGGPRAREVAASVARVLDVSETLPAITAPSVATAPTTLSQATSSSHVAVAPRRWGVFAIAAGVVIAGGIAGFTALRHNDDAPGYVAPVAAPVVEAPVAQPPPQPPPPAPAPQPAAIVQTPAPAPPPPQPAAKPATKLATHTAATVVKPKPTPKKPTTPATKEDYGASRY